MPHEVCRTADPYSVTVPRCHVVPDFDPDLRLYSYVLGSRISSQLMTPHQSFINQSRPTTAAATMASLALIAATAALAPSPYAALDAIKGRAFAAIDAAGGQPPGANRPGQPPKLSWPML